MTQPVRLLWLIDSLRIGGAEALALSFARRHDRAKYELTVAHLRTPDRNTVAAELEKTGVRVVGFEARNLRDVAALRRLLRFVRDEKIELIHAHLAYSSIWAAVASRFTRVPSVATLHTAPPPMRDRFALVERLMRVVISRWSKTVVAVSDAQRKEYATAGGIRKQKLRTVHNGIELERFTRDPEETRRRLERELGIPSLTPLVVTVSVLREGKGIDVLLRAAQKVGERFPGARFVIVGDGPKRADWQRLAADLGVAERVHWLGHRADVDAVLAGCDLFVLPTFTEALPTVVMEAMAARLPVVASAVGGVPEIVETEKTGRLVKAGDVDQLARAIADLLGDRATLERMSHEALPSVQRRFSTEAWMGRLDELYAEALS